jgi:phosphoglucosamine mutase
MKKYFGTDGIRGRVGEHPITPEFVMKLGWAAGRVLARNGDAPVLIGKDTRLSGYMFEAALEAGLSAAGVDVRLLGPIPTPGIAFLTRNTHAQAGIVISASHNPYYDNGLKFFSGDGLKLSDDLELEIEAELDVPLKVAESGKLGKARRMTDASRRYIEFCKSKLDSHLTLKGLHLVVDCAHGAAYDIAPRVFEELGARVDVIGAAPDGMNINDGYGATNTVNLQNAVREKHADVGIALDGDGDRLIMVDDAGVVVDGDETLYIIAKARLETLNGGVVGTLMSNLGLEHAIRGLNLDFHRARVGDRYVMDVMTERKLILGGESSGHIINMNLTTTGDGIISALQVLEAMLRTDKGLREIKQGMVKYPQKLLNVKLMSSVDLANHPRIGDAVRDAERQLGNHGRVLLRPSGTEPLIRVMVEGRDGDQVHALAHMLAREVENVLQKTG